MLLFKVVVVVDVIFLLKEVLMGYLLDEVSIEL
jgi:hypothetical protein